MALLSSVDRTAQFICTHPNGPDTLNVETVQPDKPNRLDLKILSSRRRSNVNTSFVSFSMVKKIEYAFPTILHTTPLL
jgi:hypothetical protein